MVNGNDWKTVNIGDILAKTKSYIQTGPFGTTLSASEFVDYGIPVISVREIREGFIRVCEETPCVSDDTYQILNKYALYINDIVFARKGSVDRSAIITTDSEKYFLGSDGIYLRLDSKKICSKFVLYSLHRNEIKKFIMQSAYGSTMAGLNEKILSEIPIVFPPTLEEQQKIADALSDMDGWIASLEKLIAKKKAIKQGAMQELLTGKKRLPEFTGKWKTVTLGDICKIYNGGTPSTSNSHYWNGNILWCTPTDITKCRSKYLYDTDSKITKMGVDACSTQLLPKGALLLCSRATIGEVCIAGNMICTNQGFKSLVVNENISNEWLYYMVSILKEKMIEKAIGSTFLEISKKDLSSLVLLQPSYQEQQAIASILSDMDAEIEALEQKLQKCRQTKQGMMQQLLTGKIRLV